MVLTNLAGDTGRGSRRAFGPLGQHVPSMCQKHRLTHEGISLHDPPMHALRYSSPLRRAFARACAVMQ